MSCGSSPSILRPSNFTSPARVASRLMIAFSVVDLPAPLRPSSATTSPARTSRSTPNSTRARPYPASRPRTSSIAKVDLPDARVSAHLFGRTGGDELTLVQHHDPIGVAENDFDVVLGEENRELLPSREVRRERHESLTLLGRHACRRLVHEEQARAVGDRHGELQALDVAVGQLGGRLLFLVVETDAAEQRVGFLEQDLARAAGKRTRQPAMREQRGLHVFARCHGTEGGRDLKSAAHAKAPDATRLLARKAAPLEADISGVGLDLAVDDVEASRLAG